jgi:hypothetical protein
MKGDELVWSHPFGPAGHLRLILLSGKAESKGYWGADILAGGTGLAGSAGYLRHYEAMKP